MPSVAQSTFTKNFRDISEKSHKALYTSAGIFEHHGSVPARMEISDLAVETCVWPLFDVIDGE